MAIAVDLHSHSSYAGGAGHINLASLAQTMRYKGIDVFGIGDCLFPAWQKQYRAELKETADGLYRFPGTACHFLRQTEIIITATLKGYNHKIIAHHIVFFPDDRAIEKFVAWMQKKGHKNTIARPFIVCRSRQELEDSLYEMQEMDPLVEIIPAHILTPDGILGSKNKLSGWTEFYGSFADNIHAVETGLSADPEMLGQIPDLRGRSFISNSDCHSSALNKVGREFTILDTDTISYESVINSIRLRKICLTAEFHPTEGRYYLTGHRGNRHPDQQQVFYVQEPPVNLECPVCGKNMLMGVRDRAMQLSDRTIPHITQPFMHLIPLIEVIACCSGVKSVTSKRVLDFYKECMQAFDTEIHLWQSDEKMIHELLDNNLPQKIIKQIIAVQKGKFIFDPPGYDGCYGILKINGE
jgi:uncharacterized protein (TIGR00375 family)